MYFCRFCLKYYNIGEMVVYKADEKKGFCRNCANQLTCNEMNELEEKGLDGLKQLEIDAEKLFPLPY